MKIYAFALAKNIKKNNYPYKMAINSVLSFVDHIVINILKSEDSTQLALRQFCEQYHDKITLVQQDSADYNEILSKDWLKNNNGGNRFYNLGKAYALRQIQELFKPGPDDYAWIMDLDEEIDPDQFKMLKQVIKVDNAEGYWFPFLHYWKNTSMIVEGKYYGAACRLFKFPGVVIGDGWTGFSFGQQIFLPEFFIKHHGFLIKERWTEKQQYYPDADMDKDSKIHNGYVYKINQPIVKNFCRPLILDHILPTKNKYDMKDIMAFPIFEKTGFCGVLANSSLIIKEMDNELNFNVNSMKMKK